MNIENLRTDLSPSEAREFGRKGGVASGESRRDRRALRNELLLLLSSTEQGETETINRKISIALVQEALKGNTKAFEIIRDTVGEKPTDKMDVGTNDVSAIKVTFGCTPRDPHKEPPIVGEYTNRINTEENTRRSCE